MTYARSIAPRRILGPDNIKYLRDISEALTGDRKTFGACRVQRNAFGGPAIEIDVAAFEKVGVGHPDSYGTMLRHRVIPEAERLAEDLKVMPEERRRDELEVILRKARREDSTYWWVLSTASLRSLLFPGAYRDQKRIDDVRYVHRPNDFHAGKAVLIGNLSPTAVASFTSFAQRMTNDQLDLASITPIR